MDDNINKDQNQPLLRVYSESGQLSVFPVNGLLPSSQKSLEVVAVVFAILQIQRLKHRDKK